MDPVKFGCWTFPTAPNTFKCLGIQIYTEPQDLLEGNLGRAIKALKTQVTFWTSLPLSVAGRVTISKMVMLPMLLYYFTNLPIIIPTHIFKMLNTMLTELIWGRDRRRVGLAKLQLSIDRGGLGVPDFQAYCYASQLQ